MSDEQLPDIDDFDRLLARQLRDAGWAPPTPTPTPEQDHLMWHDDGWPESGPWQHGRYAGDPAGPDNAYDWLGE